MSAQMKVAPGTSARAREIWTSEKSTPTTPKPDSVRSLVAGATRQARRPKPDSQLNFRPWRRPRSPHHLDTSEKSRRNPDVRGLVERSALLVTSEHHARNRYPILDRSTLSAIMGALPQGGIGSPAPICTLAATSGGRRHPRGRHQSPRRQADTRTASSHVGPPQEGMRLDES